jgi:hypothetical protein
MRHLSLPVLYITDMWSVVSHFHSSDHVYTVSLISVVLWVRWTFRNKSTHQASIKQNEHQPPSTKKFTSTKNPNRP